MHEAVTVYNPYQDRWDSGTIIAKFWDVKNASDGHVYSVQLLSGHILDNIYHDALLRWGNVSKCECGAEFTKQPGHSSWCPSFNLYMEYKNEENY